MKIFFILAAGLFFVPTSYALEWPDFSKFFGEKVADDISITQPILNFKVNIRVLDKQINTVTPYLLTPNLLQTHGPLIIEAKGCVMSHEGIIGQDVAWLTVTKGVDEDEILFDGWMFNMFPEVSALEDARFDIMVESCQVLALKSAEDISKTEIISP